MKLVSCHIENFGKFHDYSREFCDGVNVICEENGWGKSTFAAFVRAMFYGFEGERKRSLKENERRRYKPWQGGTFGGQLVFEIEGRRYQISRIFKEKEANDEFELRDAKTNLLSKDYSKKIGEEIFKINRESFMRTIFIGQNECETASTDDINAKIGNLTDNSNDLNNFEAANARLTEIINQLNPNRVSGSIAKRREEIARCERIVQGGEGILKSIENYQKNLHMEEERLDSLKMQMQKAGKEQTLVSEQQAVMARKAEWERLKKNVSAKRQDKEACRRAFPGEVPSPEEVKRKAVECGEMEKAYERMRIHQLSEEEEFELSALEPTFAGGMSANETMDGERLQARVSVVIRKWNERNSRKNALPSQKAALAALRASEEARQTAKAKGGLPLLPIGIVFVLIGVFVAVAGHLPAGICIGIVGAGLLLAGLFADRRGGTTGKDAARKSENKEYAESAQSEDALELADLKRAIEEDEAFISGVDAEVAECLGKYGRTFDEDLVSDYLQEILEESYSRRNKAEKYAALKAKQENFRKAAGEFQKVGRVVAGFLDGLGMEPSEHPAAQLEEVRDLVERYQSSARACKEAETEQNRFEAEYDMAALATIRIDDSLPTLEALNQQIQRLTEEMEKSHGTINEYNNMLEHLQQEYDEWEESRVRLKELKRQQAAEQKRYTYVLCARTKLGLAKEAMTAKYADPILKGFGRYYEMISGDAADRFHVDANTKVTVDEFGKQRDTVALSLGYQDLVGICLRIALVDAMYQEEVPFLVMDDPFTNLDDEKVLAGRKFLQELAQKYQIIYFTCSEARS